MHVFVYYSCDSSRDKLPRLGGSAGHCAAGHCPPADHWLREATRGLVGRRGPRALALPLAARPSVRTAARHHHFCSRTLPYFPAKHTLLLSISNITFVFLPTCVGSRPEATERIYLFVQEYYQCVPLLLSNDCPMFASLLQILDPQFLQIFYSRYRTEPIYSYITL